MSLYTKQFPALSWLVNEEAMTDYGYKHSEPGFGTFYSRLTKEELIEIDSSYGAEYGEVIAVSWDNEDVQNLKEQYTPGSNPFLHELIIHIWRMNNNYSEFIENENSDAARPSKP